MKHEYEAKFLSIDVADLKTRLKDLGPPRRIGSARTRSRSG